MNCVKCGRETSDEQVFCEVCLREMENYPVKPGTVVHIPSRDLQEEVKKTHTKKRVIRTPSEQILRLRKKVTCLRIVVVLLLLLCGGLGFVVGKFAEELDFQRLLGQNYHTEETAGQNDPKR